jgi:aryl-alcohol dehydrogenase-like predicted oxidoreductase
MRLALGTVQFGLDYGVSNAEGMVPEAEVSRILGSAREHGIDTLDTAAAYGGSESVLGSSNVDGFRIISKLPPVLPVTASVADWVADSVSASLVRLHQQRLYGILLHRPSQLFGPDGDALYSALRKLKSDGVVSKIGVSVYEADELSDLFQNFDFDLVQAPLSIVDRRLISSGWMSRLASKGVEVHVRSVFLQGLLLMRADERPRKFDRWNDLWRDWHSWLNESGVTAAEACVRYALSLPEIARVVVGVQSCRQLEEVVAAASRGGLEAPAFIYGDSADLLNPARWPSLA